jgi:hypothetical protein
MYRILFVLTAVLVPTPLVSQRLAPVPAYAISSPLVSPQGSRLHRLRTDSAIAMPRTYWLEGGAIGAVTVGVLGTLWFRGMSESRPGLGATVAVGALCSAVGFAPGALIGGQFRKSSKARPHAP